MLTLLETFEAIKALDTERSIIESACKKVLKMDGLKDLSEATLAKHLIITYGFQMDLSKLLVALTLAIGQLAAMNVKPGKEDQLLVGIMEQIRHEMYSFQAFEKKIRATFPEEVLEALVKVMTKEGEGSPE